MLSRDRLSCLSLSPVTLQRLAGYKEAAVVGEEVLELVADDRRRKRGEQEGRRASEVQEEGVSALEGLQLNSDKDTESARDSGRKESQSVPCISCIDSTFDVSF